MKSLLAGEQIRKTFVINCKFGRSTIYMSNFGVLVENSKGIILELDHSSILSLQQFDKKSVKIAWGENNSVYEFIFNHERPSDLTATYKTIHDDHQSLLKMIGLEGKRQTKEKITIQNPVIEPRFEKIPLHVLCDQIWNDCWFDKECHLYITHNMFFKENKGLQSRPHQIEYMVKTKDDGIVVKPERVVLKCGIPAVQIYYQNQKIWFLLPTMNDKLLTSQIEAARFAKNTEQRIDYFFHITT
jgi:hypothetical protein